MILKIKAEKAGGHIHCGFWMGNHTGALGKCGTLTFREEEWPLVKSNLGAWGAGLEIIIEEKSDDTAAE